MDLSQDKEARGKSAAKLSPSLAAVDRIMRSDNGQELRELHLRLPKDLKIKIQVCAAREELTVSAFLSQILPFALAKYPS